MGSRRLVGQSRQRSASTLIVSVALGVAATAHASDTLWLAPVSGSFGDPARWSNGVPAESSYVRFGLAPSAGVTFDITLDQPRSSQSLEVTNQSLSLDLAGLANPLGFAYVTGLLRVAGDPGAGASLTLRGGDVVAISTLVGGVPPSTEAGALAIEGGEFSSDLVSVLAGTLTYDGAEASTVTGLAPFWRVGYGQGSSGSLDVTNGSVMTPPGLVVGGLGGSGTVSVTGGSTLAIQSSGTLHEIVIGGGNVSSGLAPSAGEGLLHVAASTVTVIGAPRPIRLGFGGTGTLDLADGALVSASIEIAERGTLRCDGSVQIAGDVTSTDAAAASVQLLKDAHLVAHEVTLVANGGAIELARGASIETAEVACSSGIASTLECARDVTKPMVSATRCALHGPLRLQLLGSRPDRLGLAIPVVTAESLECGRVTLESDLSVAAYVALSESSVTLRTATTVEVGEVGLPGTLTTGYAHAATLSSVVDGTAMDVRRFATWSSDNPSVVSVEEQGVLRAVAPGRATVTALYGGESRQRAVDVADAASPPVLLASPALKGAANGHSGLEPPGAYSKVARCMSEDGNVIAFTSDADNLVPGDDDGKADVFVFDRTSGQLERVSQSTGGIAPAFGCDSPCVSPSGRLVAFTVRTQPSGGSWLGPKGEVVVCDRLLRTMEIITVTTAGTPSGGTAQPIAFSADESRVLMSHSGVDLGGGELNVSGAFLRDRTRGVTTLVSTFPDGTAMFGASAFDMSLDASRVVMQYDAWAFESGLVLYPTVVKDLSTGALTPLNESLGTPALPHSASISHDGRFVAFGAVGLGLPGPTPPPGNLGQVFVRDLETGELLALTRRDDGTWGNGNCYGITISPNGRYVTFVSEATNLFPPGTPVTGHPQVIRVDRITGERTLVSEGAFGPNSGTMGLWTGVRDDGRSVTFATDDPQFVSSAAVDPENPVRRVIVRSLGPETPSDLDGDGAVGASDLGLLLAAWNTTDALADLNGDGTVDALDLGILLGAWES
jgi:Tol biopolymer transport system component